ncbi:DUF255 domain-containing protein [Kribbella catacumbae]|uniref:DUF255 domain-containing protein n=1 Tax=Kribbella catacumbae TaxID=460086 RepID=UPI000A01E9B1
MASNELAKSTSPYLRQHAGNPVHWREWSEAVFMEARERDVPVFLSVGYSACHWCQVIGGPLQVGAVGLRSWRSRRKALLGGARLGSIPQRLQCLMHHPDASLDTRRV